MNHNEMIKMALEEGFTEAKMTETSILKFEHEWRKYCEENTCGRYNKNYSCPPHCGTPQEMQDRAQQYKHSLVLRSAWVAKDFINGEELAGDKKNHRDMTNSLVKKFKEQGIEGLVANSGPCTFCSPCKVEAGEECPFPEQRSSCLSAFCINVSTMCDDLGMKISWTDENVNFFSIFMFN
ncbi:MAG: DUF2284 domain-containing protein [Parasporobacterium sp.]|nr:DUF2284 domain-containing protein [Parasporobacterium sp.]